MNTPSPQTPSEGEDFRPVTTLLEEAERLLWEHGYFFPLVDMAKFIEALPEMDKSELGQGEKFWEDTLLLIREINFVDNEDDEETEFVELIPSGYTWECPTCGADNEMSGTPATMETAFCKQCRVKVSPLFPLRPEL